MTLDSTNLVLRAPPLTLLPVVGTAAAFAVRRIYCVGRNYLSHVRELQNNENEPPFFFQKQREMIVPAGGSVRYPSLTADFQHEIELVVALQSGGSHIAPANALSHVYGYAVGLDMTRRDLQIKMREQGRPWEIGKAFDYAAPIGVLHLKSDTGEIHSGEIGLNVNGEVKQKSDITHLIWSVNETIANLSTLFELHPGDLIFSGTPDGVGPVMAGDTMHGFIQGLSSISVKVSP
jgi:fumarylpyruvate hydrolase